MQEYFKKYNLELEDSEIKQFEKFLEIFKEKNAQINLSAIRDDEGIIEKHFVDSIMLNIFVDFSNETDDTKVKVLDLGTGGGFPLIPLAIVNPNISFTGLDSVGKKLKVVDSFAEDLGLFNVETVNGRAEDIGHKLEHREQYDYVVSRATAFLPTLLEFTIPLLKVGGLFIAYKLDDKEELRSSKKALSRLGAKIHKVKNYTIGEQKRTFIIIEKIRNTHKKFPRTTGIPLQKPMI
ncbi:MAG: 16S rRNA (guanine(527)-N(7))-methyltransferase RsmG [Candidatus Gracilibacteria bacterium]|nr:16S rRNA (guanine(527)-N(7))-methyltransferase RsmG [Candidatus Gracilibacteria bacterium]